MTTICLEKVVQVLTRLLGLNDRIKEIYILDEDERMKIRDKTESE